MAGRSDGLGWPEPPERQRPGTTGLGWPEAGTNGSRSEETDESDDDA